MSDSWHYATNDTWVLCEGNPWGPIQQATPERNAETCPTRPDTACPNEQFLGETRKHGEIFAKCTPAQPENSFPARFH